MNVVPGALLGATGTTQTLNQVSGVNLLFSGGEARSATLAGPLPVATGWHAALGWPL